MDQVDSSSSLAPFHVRNHHLIPVLSSCVAFGKLNHNVKFKKPDMKERFERWIVVSGKTYRDEEEKAMRFELFKVALENVESQLPPVEESGVLPGVPCRFPFAAPLFGFSKELYHNRSLALQFQWTCARGRGGGNAMRWLSDTGTPLRASRMLSGALPTLCRLHQGPIAASKATRAPIRASDALFRFPFPSD
ncbi:hypothetical protein ZWY2020_020983 [Hordeum vulgare]|nr:hypothetical protein ZWY2020_020983 [Hordeum vulgare]